jgi:hypothetical protein
VSESARLGCFSVVVDVDSLLRVTMTLLFKP